jgi:hypothetical protein
VEKQVVRRQYLTEPATQLSITRLRLPLGLDETTFYPPRSNPETLKAQPLCLPKRRGLRHDRLPTESDLRTVVVQLSELNAKREESVMMEVVTATVVFLSIAVFLAHAYDAFHSR